MKTLFIGVLLVSVLSACSGFIPLLTDTPTPAPSLTVAPTVEQPGGMEYTSVAEALAHLQKRRDVSIAIMKGWTIATEANGTTTWAFVPPDHPAHPAVAKRVLHRDQDGWHLEMDVLCEAVAAACDEFIRYFEALNEPIYRMSEQNDP